MRAFAISILAASSIAFWCVAQTNATTKPQRQRAEEDRVAQLIDAIRKEKGLKPLKHTAPTPYMAKLTCSVAATGEPLASLTHYDTERESFQTYSTQDLGSRPAPLLFLATDEELTRKVFPEYSVIVFRDESHPGLLVIGVARGQSRRGQWWGCTALNFNNWLEDGCNDYPVKPSISPECTEER
jgi:hypothetical protein